MQITGFDKLNLTPLHNGFAPFFEQFNTDLTLKEKDQIIASILQSSCSMISKEIERQKKTFKTFRDV